MKTEIEVKFLDVNFADIRKQLTALNGKCTHSMRDMRRALCETPEMKERNAFLRLRDEGDKVTLTYKQFDELSLSGAKEIEVDVSDFEATLDILKVSGLEPTTYQESRRETWQVGEAEVVLDEWPWIPPYIEIEGHSEEIVRDIAKQLGFDWNDAVFGGADTIYAIKYPERTVRGVIDIKEVRFDDPVPSEFLGLK